MKKKSGTKSVETHCLSQTKYPMPDTDLGYTTAIPYYGAYDVDMSAGGNVTKGPIPTQTFVVAGKGDIPKKNPTRWD